ncbi:MAG: N-acetylglucosamine-6-phosphate deacetylase [Epulopiscium sp.]|nr:N-acetylglucosamine-6-phosphate deacetylase [Candidatus Epulonipiscium sp.]
MKKCLHNGKLILKDGIVMNKALIFSDTIEDIVDEKDIVDRDDIEKIDVKGAYISPGFIDIHIHGYGGYDVMDGEIEKLKDISQAIAANGVTSFLATTMTMDIPEIRKALEVVREVKKEGTVGAEVLGAHMEGPFINPVFKGAQNEKYIISPDIELVKEFQDVVRLITLAPEVEGAKEFIKEVKDTTDIVLSMGHTDATFEEALEGIEAGISHATHLFNAMTGLLHRKPGVVGAALSTDVTCELIADTIHIHPGLYSFLLKTKGLDKIVLITDCMSAGGMEEGKYELGGQPVFVKDGQARLEDGTLAGSVLKLNQGLYNMHTYTGKSLEELVRLVSYNPATVLGIEDKKGSLAIGKDADITVFDENVHIAMTIGKGKLLYENH